MAGRNEQKKALKAAILAGDLAVVRALCAADPGLATAGTSHRNVPIQAAIDARQLDITRFLLDQGADPHHANHGGWTLMDSAAGHGGEPFVALLRARGVAYGIQHAVGLGDLDGIRSGLVADPEALGRPLGRRRSTLLHLAAREGQADSARLLLDAGAEVDPLDKEGFTPLAVLAAYGPKAHRPAVAAVLLAHGADVHADCGYAGRDVVEYATHKRDRPLLAVLEARR